MTELPPDDSETCRCGREMDAGQCSCGASLEEMRERADELTVDSWRDEL